MPSVSMRQLLEAGVHFGHQTRRWNPKMKPFIFAERNGIHIIDLAQTVQRLDVALEFVRETVARGEQVLFVGTKKQAQEPVAQEATRANQPYVNKRWLGGMLTNFVTIKKRIGLLEQLEARQDNGDFERMTKKEAAKLTEEMIKLQGTLGGMRKMKRLPGAIFIVDPHRERIAVTEANKLEIRSSAPATRTSTPTSSTYIIPANDDAIRAIRLLCTLVADAAIEGTRARRPAQRSPSRSRRWPLSGGRDEVPGATDELVAALAGGAALSFEPDADDDDLLPGDRVARAGRGPPSPRRPGGLPEEIAAEPAREAAERRTRTTARPRCGPGKLTRGRSQPARTHESDPAAGLDRAAARQENEQAWRTSRRSSSRKLRERTGAGFMDCKRADVEADDDLDKAILLLREQGLAAAAKKAGRDARGRVSSPHPIPGRSEC